MTNMEKTQETVNKLQEQQFRDTNFNVKKMKTYKPTEIRSMGQRELQQALDHTRSDAAHLAGVLKAIAEQLDSDAADLETYEDDTIKRVFESLRGRQQQLKNLNKELRQ